MVCFLCGEGPNFFFISRELWRLEISAVEEQRPFWELPWQPRADWGGTKKFSISRPETSPETSCEARPRSRFSSEITGRGKRSSRGRRPLQRRGRREAAC